MYKLAIFDESLCRFVVTLHDGEPEEGIHVVNATDSIGAVLRADGIVYCRNQIWYLTLGKDARTLEDAYVGIIRNERKRYET